jgi:hypothetical protein
MTAETETVAGPTLDPAVFDEAEPLIDTWVNGLGKRLYVLAGRIGDHPPIHVLTSYERSIDNDTGEAVEVETVEGLGRLVPFFHMGTDTRRATQTLIDDNPELWDEGAVEHMHETFEYYLEDRLQELVETAPARNFVDIHLLSKIRIGFDEDLEAQKLADRDRSFGKAEWEAYLWAVMEETTLIDDLYGEGVEADRAYGFRPEFEDVPEWRLRAVENHHCGVWKNAPALANLAALRESEEVSTQAEMAEELGKDESTISQQMADVDGWLARARWMCENR